MKLTEIILDKFPPQNLRAVWLHPSDTGIEVFIYNNGKWEEISVLDKSGDSVTIGNKDNKFTIIAKDGIVHVQDQNDNIYQVITTATSVGQKTLEGGEIFNDYEDNSAGATYAHAEGRRVTVTGNAAHGEGIGTKATNANAHAEGNSTTASGPSSHSEGYNTIASGPYTHTEGNGTQATANAAHAEGTNTVASAQNAHAEGQNNTADAAQAHVEGGNNTAHGQNSHAEGNGNTANGGSSHVEGYDNTAEGSYCHVEGGHNTASGSGSHAEGIGTQATNEGEHAEGRYNISNNGGTSATRTVHSVGVGTPSAKRNAHEIMWSGDHYIYGLGGYDGTDYAGAQTLQEVINGKQGSTDNTLQTASKTITGAINELFSSKQDNITPGTGLAFDGNTLNVTLDTTVFRVVSSLPAAPDAGDENKIFLVPNPSSTDEGNYYTEYIWVVDTEHPDGHYEELGTYKSDIDLSIYQTKTDNNLQTTNKTVVGAINEVDSKSGYYIDTFKLTSKATSEEISEAIGGYDNLLNAVNNKIPIYTFNILDGISVFSSIIYINSEENGITLGYILGTNINFIGILNNNGILSCIEQSFGLQTTNDDKLNTSSKTIVGAINEINDKTPVYTTVPTLTANYTIPANATTREYIYEISIGATTYNVTAAEGIKWIDNNLPLVEANSKLIVSVVNNIAVWGTVYE